MYSKKPVLWILHPCVHQQMTFSEHLNNDYDLLFFDSILSMKRYMQVSGKNPDLLIADLITANSNFVFMNNISSKKIGLAGEGITAQVLEASSSLWNEIVFSFSASQIKILIDELLNDDIATPPLYLVQNPKSQEPLFSF